MIYFASDTHFCHDRGFIYTPRGFTTVAEMNAAIIERWNKVVKNDDTVYLLGDVMLNDNEEGMKCLAQLNGRIHILIGNHDTASRLSIYETLPNVTVEGYADIVKYGKYTFYISHYPTNTSNLEKDAPLSQHVINLYGHTHQQTNFYQDIPYMYHIGMDSHFCTPVSAEEVLEDIRKKVEECKSQL